MDNPEYVAVRHEVKRHSKHHVMEPDDILLQCEGFVGLMGVPFGVTGQNS